MSSSSSYSSSDNDTNQEDIVFGQVIDDDDQVETETRTKQMLVESDVLSHFDRFDQLVELNNDFNKAVLNRTKHVQFLKNGLFNPPKGIVGLYASQTWIVYWILNGLSLLDSMPTAEELQRVVVFLKQCKNPDGGFGGGFQQISHLASTYAALLAICIIGTEEAYDLIDRPNLYKWLLSLKNPDGSFLMHEGGEVDVRASYIALVCASLTNTMTPTLVSNVGNFVASCQSYEGGIGSLPGAEAHGGYTFCGLAAMHILGESHKLNMSSLLAWAVQRQMNLEGGFQGRTNKLVDGCYSWWQGALFPILDELYVNSDIYKEDTSADPLDAWDESEGSWIMNQFALQKYILLCCQNLDGGLRDKPSVKPDYYHTCYVLSGLSAAQHNAPYSLEPVTMLGLPAAVSRNNLLPTTHPVYNVPPRKVFAIKKHFESFSKVE